MNMNNKLKIQYKLKNNTTGFSTDKIKSFNVNSDGEVHSVLIDGGEIIIDEEFHELVPFLEVIDGVKIYDKDQAIIALSLKYDRYGFEESIDNAEKILSGEFRELYKGGCYYFVSDNKVIAYNLNDIKIVKMV